MSAECWQHGGALGVRPLVPWLLFSSGSWLSGEGGGNTAGFCACAVTYKTIQVLEGLWMQQGHVRGPGRFRVSLLQAATQS